MITTPQYRPPLWRYAHLLIPIMLAACSSGSDGGGDSGFSEALRAYEESARQRSTEVATAIASASVEQLASGPSDGDLPASRFQNEITGLTSFLCAHIEDLGAIAGSGDTKEGRLDDLRVRSEEIVRDSFAGALLDQVLAEPPDRREQLLDALGVKATGSDGVELRGTAALQSLGLLDDHGQIALPARSTDPYTRYERWLSAEGRGLAGTVSRLEGDVRSKLDRCTSSA